MHALHLRKVNLRQLHVSVCHENKFPMHAYIMTEIKNCPLKTAYRQLFFVLSFS